MLQKQSIRNTTQVADDASVYQIMFKLKKKMPVKSKTDRHRFEDNIFSSLNGMRFNPLHIRHQTREKQDLQENSKQRNSPFIPIIKRCSF